MVDEGWEEMKEEVKEGVSTGKKRVPQFIGIKIKEPEGVLVRALKGALASILEKEGSDEEIVKLSEDL